ncbi:MAG: hypothetical protein IKC11_03430 [Clostridia bacterium]|nr:hypothetical protein [Clostridia bacterium]
MTKQKEGKLKYFSRLKKVEIWLGCTKIDKIFIWAVFVLQIFVGVVCLSLRGITKDG